VAKKNKGGTQKGKGRVEEEGDMSVFSSTPKGRMAPWESREGATKDWCSALGVKKEPPPPDGRKCWGREAEEEKRGQTSYSIEKKNCRRGGGGATEGVSQTRLEREGENALKGRERGPELAPCKGGSRGGKTRRKR